MKDKDFDLPLLDHKILLGSRLYVKVGFASSNMPLVQNMGLKWYVDFCRVFQVDETGEQTDAKKNVFVIQRSCIADVVKGKFHSQKRLSTDAFNFSYRSFYFTGIFKKSPTKNYSNFHCFRFFDTNFKNIFRRHGE